MSDASVQPAAGWYPDPGGHPQQRYWDGQKWTEHFAPAFVYQPTQNAGRSGALAALGLLMAVLMPLIGFVLGLVLLGRKQDRDGLVVVMVSIAVFILWYALVVRGG